MKKYHDLILAEAKRTIRRIVANSGGVATDRIICDSIDWANTHGYFAKKPYMPEREVMIAHCIYNYLELPLSRIAARNPSLIFVDLPNELISILDKQGPFDDAKFPYSVRPGFGALYLALMNCTIEAYHGNPKGKQALAHFLDCFRVESRIPFSQQEDVCVDVGRILGIQYCVTLNNPLSPVGMASIAAITGSLPCCELNGISLPSLGLATAKASVGLFANRSKNENIAERIEAFKNRLTAKIDEYLEKYNVGYNHWEEAYLALCLIANGIDISDLYFDVVFLHLPNRIKLIAGAEIDPETPAKEENVEYTDELTALTGYCLPAYQYSAEAERVVRNICRDKFPEERIEGISYFLSGIIGAQIENRDAELAVSRAVLQISAMQKENEKLTERLNEAEKQMKNTEVALNGLIDAAYQRGLQSAQSELTKLNKTIRSLQYRLDTALKNPIPIPISVPVQEEPEQKVEEPDTPSPQVEKPKEIVFPYYTGRKIVLIGGHPVFVVELKKLLPEINTPGFNGSGWREPFYAYQNPISNADIVILQTNKMSHSMYYSCKDYAKKQGKMIYTSDTANAHLFATQFVNRLAISEEDGMDSEPMLDAK